MDVKKVKEKEGTLETVLWNNRVALRGVRYNREKL